MELRIVVAEDNLLVTERVEIRPAAEPASVG
jgi:hypothetical protein